MRQEREKLRTKKVYKIKHQLLEISQNNVNVKIFPFILNIVHVDKTFSR